MKIFISAYACEPNKGSEPGTGWNWANQIAKFHKVWIITRSNNKLIIEEELKKNPIPNLNFYYTDLPKWMRFWKKGARGLYLYYLLWQLAVYFAAKKLHNELNFTITHHVTFGNILLPTFIPFLPTPFIWGPLGGGEKVPRQFLKNYNSKLKFYEYFREFIQTFLFKINPITYYSLRKSKAIILKTPNTLKLIPPKYRSKALILTHSAFSKNELHFNSSQKKHQNLNFKAIFVGRLVHWKGCDLAIESFAKFSKKNEQAELLIIGEGPDYKRLLNIKQKQNAKNIYFAGLLSRQETLKKMNESDVLLFPSLKDAGPKVLFEALFLALPIIYFDISNFAEIITDSCGIKIKAESPAQAINDLAEAMEILAINKELRNKLSKAAKERSLMLDWDKKGKEIKKIYDNLLTKNDC